MSLHEFKVTSKNHVPRVISGPFLGGGGAPVKFLLNASKRGQKLVTRAVLLFKGEETGCILIRSLHLKINLPNGQNKKCSKVKRSIQKKKCAKLSEKNHGK